MSGDGAWKFRKPKRNMAEHIRRKTHNGREIVDFMLNVMRGENVKYIKTRDRLEAAKFLADRGWGRAVEQSVQLRLEAGQSPEVLDALPTSDLLNVIKAIQNPPSEETVDGHVLQANNAIPEVLKDNPAAEAIIDVVLKREDT